MHVNCVENCDGYVAERGEKKKDKKDKNSESVKIKLPLMSFWNLIT